MSALKLTNENKDTALKLLSDRKQNLDMALERARVTGEREHMIPTFTHLSMELGEIRGLVQSDWAIRSIQLDRLNALCISRPLPSSVTPEAAKNLEAAIEAAKARPVARAS